MDGCPARIDAGPVRIDAGPVRVGRPDVTVNPIVAASLDRPRDVWSGAWIAEDIELIAQGVRDGSWIDGSLGVIGAGLDALAVISDPVGVLLQYGVAWIIEHVRPLTEALDWLAGDPGAIAAQTQTWRNVAAGLRADAASLGTSVRSDVVDWSGGAAEAYRSWAARQETALGAMASAADTMAAITEGAGTLVAAVRVLVRDAIATVVSRLIGYALEEVASLGLATPLLLEQVSTLVAAWAAKIARWLTALLRSLSALAARAAQLERAIEALKRILGGLRKGGPEAPPGPRSPGPQPPGPRESGPREPRPRDPEGEPSRGKSARTIGGPAEFDPQELRGLSADEVRARIPDDWRQEPSTAGGGQKFIDPAHGGRQIRIMPGYPPGSREDPVSWGPYAVVSQNGVKGDKIPLEGNPTLR